MQMIHFVILSFIFGYEKVITLEKVKSVQRLPFVYQIRFVANLCQRERENLRFFHKKMSNKICAYKEFSLQTLGDCGCHRI